MNKANKIALFLSEVQRTQLHDTVIMKADHDEAIAVSIIGNNKYDMRILDNTVNEADSEVDNIFINQVESILNKLSLTKYKYMFRNDILLYNMKRRMM